MKSYPKIKYLPPPKLKKFLEHIFYHKSFQEKIFFPFHSFEERGTKLFLKGRIIPWPLHSSATDRSLFLRHVAVKIYLYLLNVRLQLFSTDSGPFEVAGRRFRTLAQLTNGIGHHLISVGSHDVLGIVAYIVRHIPTRR